jgi:HD-like signal output (HDOD) protein
MEARMQIRFVALIAAGAFLLIGQGTASAWKVPAEFINATAQNHQSKVWRVTSKSQSAKAKKLVKQSRSRASSLSRLKLKSKGRLTPECQKIYDDAHKEASCVRQYGDAIQLAHDAMEQINCFANDFTWPNGCNTEMQSIEDATIEQEACYERMQQDVQEYKDKNCH